MRKKRHFIGDLSSGNPRPNLIVRLFLLTALLAGLGMPAPKAVPRPCAHSKSAPVERLVDPDGTLNLNTGFSGAVDLTGWEVMLDSTRGPMLTRQNRGAPEVESESNIGWSSERRGVGPSLPQAVGWSALPNNGLNGTVRAIAVSGSDVYVGGGFDATADGAVLLNNIAKFSGGVWSALPNNGLINTVRALAVSGSDLYVGGDFTQTTDGAVTNMNNIAKFSGGVWSALPHNGLNGGVSALAVSGSDLYVGGNFTQTSDGAVTNLNHIAKFSGGVWSALPHSGLNGGPQAFAIVGSDLYVAGPFAATFDGAVLLNNIAKFSGGAWSALPNNGLNAAVHALAVSGSDLYVAGEFSATRDGAVTNLNGIAKFSGGVWSPLPNNGLNGFELALAVNGSDLYVGGALTQTFDGAVKLNNIARFGGGVWSPLPNNGLNSSVNALAVSGSGDLYAGGDFTATRDGMVMNLNRIAKFSSVPPPTPTLQFSSATYSVNEGCVAATITVNRSGDTSSAVTVDWATSDGTAFQRTDYTIGTGTVTVAGGATSQTFSVLISKNAYHEGPVSLNLTLSNPTGGASLGNPSAATLTIVDDTTVPTTSQPIDDANTFVCQHYHDFLSREPDGPGLTYWSGQITQCGSDQNCIRAKRIDVSNAFFFELEYQQTGAYVFRLYRAAFGNTQPFPNPDASNTNLSDSLRADARKLPSYAVFARDRARVVGGADLATGQQNLANAFVQRPEFLAKYPANLDGSSFIDAVLATIKNDIGADLTSQKPALMALFNSGGRGAVIYRLADDNATTNPINNRAFIDAEYNRAFVTTQYFGYLRRDADIGGLLFWLNQVNGAPLRDTTKQHAMVCSFITSAEYQNRFSAMVTHTNAECPQ